MNESTINKRIHVLKVVLLGNLTICIGKIIVGILSGLLFIVADGIHSLSDTLTNFVGIFSLKLATRKPDEKHPYGYEKYETIGTLIVGCFCLFMAFEVMKESISLLLNPAESWSNIMMAYAMMSIGVIVNCFVYYYESRSGRKLGSDLLIADAKETKSDIFLSIAVILGIYLSDIGLLFINGLLTLLISLIIFRTAINIIKESSDVLTDINVVPREKIYNIVMSHPEVRFCHAIRSRGRPDSIFIDLHIGVDPMMPVEKAHDIVSHEIKLMLKNAIPGLKCVNIHIEPDNESARLRARSIFKKLDY